MQIGEFAKLCDTRISVLRHYDSVGLLTPDYIDRFTGYRYYSAAQIDVYMRIDALKKAGFSLKEIADILPYSDDSNVIMKHIESKRCQLNETIVNLDKAEKILMGVEKMIKCTIKNAKDNRAEIWSSPIKNPIDNDEFAATCRSLDETATTNNYQRVSGYKSIGEPESKIIYLAIDVIKLNDFLTEPHDNTELQFENDEAVIGKWEVIGDYMLKEDFFADRKQSATNYGDINRFIYFLPLGQKYWCYGWTKGKLYLMDGMSSSVNDYSVEEYNGNTYMFVQNKSYYYRRGGNPSVLVLRQIDHEKYNKNEISRTENIDLPFINDEVVLGSWKSIGYCKTMQDFWNEKIYDEILFFKSIIFETNGKCTSVYEDETIGNNLQSWTKDYVLRKWNRTACKYEIVSKDDKEYLLIEWKSGDWRWGGFDTDYYVFVRQ